MKSYQSRDARLKMREILTAVEQGEHVEIKRYETSTAVMVSAEWYKQALADLGHFKPQPMSQRCRDGFHCGTGDDRCINCWCLCHDHEGPQEARVRRNRIADSRVAQLSPDPRETDPKENER